MHVKHYKNYVGIVEDYAGRYKLRTMAVSEQHAEREFAEGPLIERVVSVKREEG